MFLSYYYLHPTAHSKCRGSLLHLISINDTQTHTHTHSKGIFWTSDQTDTETSTKQTTLLTNGHPCSGGIQTPQSQQASGRRHTLYTARPTASA